MSILERIGRDQGWKWASVPFHPFLVALHPIVSLLAANVGDVEPVEAIRPLLLSLLLAACVLTLLSAVLKEWPTAALVTTIFLVLFSTYGHVYHWLKPLAIDGWIPGRHRFLGPLWLVVLASLCLLVLRSRPIATNTTVIANTVAVVAVLLPLLTLAGQAWIEDSSHRNPPSIVLAPPDGHPADSDLPDIYFIILDMYSRADVLIQEVGFDNAPFLTALEARGFQVLECSRSNYPGTILSLASTLSHEYLPVGTEPARTRDALRSAYLPILLASPVRRELEAAGYVVVAYESGFLPTEWKDADEYRAPPKDLVSEAGLTRGVNAFEGMWLNGSAATVVYSLRKQLPPSWIPWLDAAYLEHRDRILFELTDLQEARLIPGPKFVFAHILAPHDPFVFGPHGEAVVRKTPFTLNGDVENVLWPQYAGGYRGQVQFLNSRILQVVDHILAENQGNSIVVIQGDHGIMRLLQPWANVAILNAIYLPDRYYARLGPAMSSVNTFRYIESKVLGMDLPLLAEQSFTVAPTAEGFIFVPVAEGGSQCMGKAADTSSASPVTEAPPRRGSADAEDRNLP